MQNNRSHSDQEIQQAIDKVWELNPAIEVITTYYLAYIASSILKCRKTECYTYILQQIAIGNMIRSNNNVGIMRPKKSWNIASDFMTNKDISNQPSVNQPAINDHVCPGCKNDRVSKSEKSCWRCGGKL